MTYNSIIKVFHFPLQAVLHHSSSKMWFMKKCGHVLMFPIQKQLLPDVLQNRWVIKNFSIFTEKRISSSLFLIKLETWRSATLLNRYSNTGVFLRILGNFKEQLSLWNSSGGCFCRFMVSPVNSTIQVSWILSLPSLVLLHLQFF